MSALEEYIRLERLRRFAATSEKVSGQYELFNEAELCEAAEEALVEQEAARETAPQRGKPGRKPLPAELPRIRIEHDLDEADRQCSCGCALSAIGEVTSEQLDIVPARIRVLVNVRKQYACKRCESTLKTTPLPPQPIPTKSRRFRRE